MKLRFLLALTRYVYLFEKLEALRYRLLLFKLFISVMDFTAYIFINQLAEKCEAYLRLFLGVLWPERAQSQLYE